MGKKNSVNFMAFLISPEKSTLIMQHEEIKRLLSFSPAVKLLRSKNAPLIISFLYEEFKANNRITLPAYELISHLAEYIEALEDQELMEIEGKDSLVMARKFLDNWCNEDHRFLKRYPNDEGEPIVELTTHTEKAFQWMENLQKREFVGTESRFLNIYRQLRELIDNTSADPKRRIKELEKKKKALTREINAIKKSGTVETFNDTQIKERFYNITKTARELLSDFKEVEHNFKDISLNIYRQQTKEGVNRGQILGYTLDATEQLKGSDQGKSFYAFWQFLIADTKQDELMEMIHYTYKLLKEKNIDYADNFLRKIKIYLHNAGQKVIDSNHLLAEKLSRILAEQSLVERRRAIEIIREIKNLAVSKIGKLHGKKDFIYIEGLPEIDMSFDRPIGNPPQRATFKNQPTEIGSTQLASANLGVLFDQFEMDRQQLETNITELLKNNQEITLSEVVRKYPIQNGLAEVLTYFSIAATSKKHLIRDDKKESIPWILAEDIASAKKEIHLPQVIYVR